MLQNSADFTNERLALIILRYLQTQTQNRTSNEIYQEIKASFIAGINGLSSVNKGFKTDFPENTSRH